MEHIHLKGALVGTWLFILGHLPQIDEAAQIVAFLASAAVSIATFISWLHRKDK